MANKLSLILSLLLAASSVLGQGNPFPITNGILTNNLNGNGQSITGLNTAGSSLQPLDADLTAIAALTGTNTIYYRSGTNVWSAVTIGSGLTFSGGTLAASGAGLGDFSSNTTVSVDGEIVLFSGTGGKTGKRATGSGIAKIASGVLGTATSGTDYAPATSGSAILYGNGAGGFGNVTLGSGLAFNTGTGTLSSGGGSTVFLSSDFTTTSTTFVNVTGLSFTANANKNYAFSVSLRTNKSDANGLKLQWTGPASPTLVFMRQSVSTTADTAAATDVLTAFSTPSTTGNTVAANGWSNSILDIFSNGANAGTVQLQVECITGGTAKVLTGSYIQVTESP